MQKKWMSLKKLRGIIMVMLVLLMSAILLAGCGGAIEKPASEDVISEEAEEEESDLQEDTVAAEEIAEDTQSNEEDSADTEEIAENEDQTENEPAETPAPAIEEQQAVETPAPAIEEQQPAETPAPAIEEQQPVETPALIPTPVVNDTGSSDSGIAAGNNNTQIQAQSIPASGTGYVVNANNGKIHINGACAATGNGPNAMHHPVYFDTYEEAEAYSIRIAPSQDRRQCGNCW